MIKRNYLNFDLQFERQEDHYRLEAYGPAGRYIDTFYLPFTDTELENLILRISRTRRVMRRIDHPDIKISKHIGQRLYTAVFKDQIDDLFRKSLDQAEQQDFGLRLRIHLNQTPELANLPWECLYNQTLNNFLALSVETPIIRYLDIPRPIRPLAVELPLRVLVIISNPQGLPFLDVSAEWDHICTALSDLVKDRMVILERLERPTLGDLQGRLRRDAYHILHFVGHGTYDNGSQDGMLMLEDRLGDRSPVSGQELGMLLHDHRSLRLVILNVCEGGRSSAEDPFAGVAQSLIQQSIPAVIAMQFEISDEAAILIAHEFYGAITDGYPIDGALSEARKSIFAQGYRLEWATPVLYLRATDGHIFMPSAINSIQGMTIQEKVANIFQDQSLDKDSSNRQETKQQVSINSEALKTHSQLESVQQKSSIFYTVATMFISIVSIVFAVVFLPRLFQRTDLSISSPTTTVAIPIPIPTQFNEAELATLASSPTPAQVSSPMVSEAVSPIIRPNPTDIVVPTLTQQMQLVSRGDNLRVDGWSYSYPNSNYAVYIGTQAGGQTAQGEFLSILVFVSNGTEKTQALPSDFFVVRDAQGRSYTQIPKLSNALVERGVNADVGLQDPILNNNAAASVYLVFDVSKDATDLMLIARNNPYQGWALNPIK